LRGVRRQRTGLLRGRGVHGWIGVHRVDEQVPVSVSAERAGARPRQQSKRTTRRARPR
jgi:hypothetical protein